MKAKIVSFKTETKPSKCKGLSLRKCEATLFQKKQNPQHARGLDTSKNKKPTKIPRGSNSCGNTVLQHLKDTKFKQLKVTQLLQKAKPHFRKHKTQISSKAQETKSTEKIAWKRCLTSRMNARSQNSSESYVLQLAWKRDPKIEWKRGLTAHTKVRSQNCMKGEVQLAWKRGPKTRMKVMSHSTRQSDVSKLTRQRGLTIWTNTRSYNTHKGEVTPRQ